MIPPGLAFGIASVNAGLSVWQASTFSLFVFAGSAQFAAVEVIGDGGSVVAAILAGLLLNLRSLAFGVAMASSLTGPWWRRAAWSQLMIDETTAIGSAQSEHRWRRFGYVRTGLILFTSWNLSTLVGATLLSSSGDAITKWGIDAAIPAVFLAVVWPRLRDVDQRQTALAGAVIALALVPVAPAGVPIIAAAVAVVLGRRSGKEPRAAVTT